MYNESQFANNLLNWYEVNKRDLPWRHTSNPYYIWLSEMMLQQTQVSTVIPYYNAFIHKFPTIETLANATIEEVYPYFEGLGYYRRIEHFHDAIKEVQSVYGGEVPHNANQFRQLKGVGDYTEGAVMSIAFNQLLPAVDGNVVRVFSRLDCKPYEVVSSKGKKYIKDRVETLIPLEAGDFNQSLMELGATVCTPKAPKCEQCPVQQHCEAYETYRVDEFPVKKKKTKKQHEYYDVFVIKTKQDELIIEQRPKTGLLRNMYQFPMFDHYDEEHVEQHINERIHIYDKAVHEIEHIFTHKVWHLTVHYGICLTDGSKHIVLDEKHNYPMSVSMKKIKEAFEQNNS